MSLLGLCCTLACVGIIAAQGPPGFAGTTTTPNGTPPTPQPAFQAQPPVPPSVPPTAMQLAIAVMLAGQYSNGRQFQEDAASNVSGPAMHALIQAIYVPVIVSALGSAVTFYYEQRVNNETRPVRQAIYAFSQESPCLVRMSTFDISNASSVTYESLRALEGLQLVELTNRPECDSFWEEIGDEFFTSYPSTDQCVFGGPGGIKIRPEGSRNLTCSGMSFSETWRRVPGGQLVGGIQSPYLLQKVDNLFPVPVSAFNSNQCFKAPCSNSNSIGKNTNPSWSAIKEQMNYAKKSGI